MQLLSNQRYRIGSIITFNKQSVMNVRYDVCEEHKIINFKDTSTVTYLTKKFAADCIYRYNMFTYSCLLTHEGYILCEILCIYTFNSLVCYWEATSHAEKVKHVI